MQYDMRIDSASMTAVVEATVNKKKEANRADCQYPIWMRINIINPYSKFQVSTGTSRCSVLFWLYCLIKDGAAK